MKPIQSPRQIYSKQYFLIAFISSVAFKVVMLPQYLTVSAGRQAYWTMAIMMAIELLMLTIVYGVVRQGSLLELPIPKMWKAVICIAIFASAIFKCGVLTSETLAYVSSTMFDNAEWLYILLALLPCLFYISYKGGNVIARTSEILFWFLAATFLFNILFARLQGDLHNLLPILSEGTIAVAGDKHLIWYGDFTTLLFLQVIPSPKKARPLNALAVIAVFLCPVLLMIAFIVVYGGGGVLVSNAFSKLAIFNKLSFLLGTVDFPTVCSWLIMAVIKLSLILYGATECLRYFFPKRAVCAAAAALTLGAVVLFGMRSLQHSYAVATGFLRYVFGFIEYSVPMIVYGLTRIYSKRQVDASSCLFPSLMRGNGKSDSAVSAQLREDAQ